MIFHKSRLAYFGLSERVLQMSMDLYCILTNDLAYLGQKLNKK